MKVKITINVDTKTGEYDIQYNSDTKESIEQSTLSKILDRVITHWSMKFVD